MNKLFSIFFLAVALVTLTACATTKLSPQKPRYVVVDAAAAKELFDRNALFIDVRTVASFNDRHIPRAVNMTWGRRFTKDRLANLADPDQEIVIYCYGIHCELSSKATDAAVAWGYTGVHYFEKGFPAWWGAGYPIEQ